MPNLQEARSLHSITDPFVTRLGGELICDLVGNKNPDSNGGWRRAERIRNVGARGLDFETWAFQIPIRPREKAALYGQRFDSTILLGARSGPTLGPNLENQLKAHWHCRAKRRGHSMEEEAHDILRNALREEETPSAGLGTEIAALFRNNGLQEEIPELRGHVITRF